MALLLAGVLAAGLAAAPAQVWAEETGESPVQEEVLKAEEKKEEKKASEEEKKEVPAEAPAEKSEEKTEEKTEESVKEPAEEINQVLEQAPDKAPEEQPAEDLAESPAEDMKLFGAEPEDPEEDGEDDTDDEPYYEYYDDVDDLDVVLDEEEGLDLGLYGTVYTQDGEEDFSVNITGAAAADPSVAEVGLDGQSVRITGKKIGSTRVTVTYAGPEGERKTAFTVHVKETVYDVEMYSSADEYYLEAGSSTDHWITVDSRSAGDYQNLKEEDVTVVWNYTYSPESLRDVFDLEGKGFSAVLRVDKELPYHEALEVSVTAEVYLGSEVSEDKLIGSDEMTYVIGDYYIDTEIGIDVSEDVLFNDPKSEAEITLSAEPGVELTVKKWAAIELDEDGERLGPVDYPFGDPDGSLSTTVNGQVLAGLVGEGVEVEFFAVVDDEDGKDVTTDSVYILVRGEEMEVDCDVEDIKTVPGAEYSEYVSATAYVVNADYPMGESIDCEILRVNIDDAAIADVSFEDGMINVKGIKKGTTQAHLIYAGPDGEEGKYDFTVTVADAVYYVYIEDSYDEYEMLIGDQADLKVSVYRYAKDDEGTDYTELDDDEIDVVWEMESEDEDVPATDFTLTPEGSAATLLVTGGAGPEEDTQSVVVRARVYLKGTDEEIGSEEIAHSHVAWADFLVAEDTLPEGELKVGESFTITPCVLKKKELDGGEKSTERETKALFGLYFDPSQVRVTDQNGQEVEPAETDDDDRLLEGQADGVVYTVTRLSTDDIEIELTAQWPGREGDDEYYQRTASKTFYLGSLDEDEPNEPGSHEETSPQGGSGKDKGNSKPSSTGKSGKTSSSSKSAKTSKTTKTSRTGKKTATGDTSDSMLWILLMTASAAACLTAAGFRRKRTR